MSPEARLAVMSTRSSYLSLTGRTRQASDSIAAAHALARQLHGATLVPDLTVAEVFVDWLSGRWDAALVRARRATLDASRGHELFTMPLLRAVEASIETDRGNLSVARAICEEAYLRTAFGATFLAWAAAGVDLASGDLDGARSRLLDALAVEREQGRVSSTLLILYRLIEVERKADRQEGNRWLDELEDACDATESPWAEVRRLRARAFLNGDLDAAAKSVTIAEQEGFPFEAAVTRVLSPAPDEAIGDELRRAYETFRSLDADPWRRRAAAELRVRGLPVPRARRRSIDGLSETELRIASLVRDGMSNREISGMLHFSPKTVEHYLTTIYRRTGCAGRLELALAFQRGTLDLGGSD